MILRKSLIINVVLQLAYYLLIFSEVRTIRYSLMGSREISFSDIIFVVAGSVFVVYISKRAEKFLFCHSIKSIFLFNIPLWALFLCLLIKNNPYTHLTTPFQLLGLIVFMCLSCFFFFWLAEERILTGIYRFTIVMSLLFFVQYLIIFYWTTKHYSHPISQYLFYGQGTPNLYRPFNSPSQAALFISIVLFLLVGGSLSLDKRWPLYFFVPPLFLAAAQTGSRSVMLLLLCGWAGYVILTGLHLLITNVSTHNNMLHLIAVSILAGVVFFCSGINQEHEAAAISRERSFGLLGASIMSIISGSADDFRKNEWNKAFADQFSPVQENASDEPPESEQEKDFDSTPKSTHNIYIDFLTYKGPIALVILICFLIWLAFKELVLLIRVKHRKIFYLHAATFVGLIIVIGEFYGNPVFHLRYIWVFFGLITAMSLKSTNSDEISADTPGKLSII